VKNSDLDFDVHALAKQMVADGWFGQPMRNPEKSEDFILAAADDPDIQSKLPEDAASFWKTARSMYYGDKLREKICPATEEDELGSVITDHSNKRRGGGWSPITRPLRFLGCVLLAASNRARSPGSHRFVRVRYLSSCPISSSRIGGWSSLAPTPRPSPPCPTPAQEGYGRSAFHFNRAAGFTLACARSLHLAMLASSGARFAERGIMEYWASGGFTPA